MAFEYRLEVLLKLQNSIEHQQENRLMTCASQVAKLNSELEHIHAIRAERKKREMLEMENGVIGILIQMATEWDQAMRNLETAARERLVKAEKARAEQTTVYKAARQKREVLESLKERLKGVYDSEELRRMQQVLDDTFLMRAFFWKES